ncbi:hypothetical protein BGZ99_010512 [Dissophora globulifera]|uniref:Peptidase S54 rhomboid domain-containing protein n=1 Tax=Dissophora globulifera TaxID=979702 RepID=A0A9P6R611_9FUNG|nr:hypothetical protein BGZ99_010512 [Dissophora globulifera]
MLRAITRAAFSHDSPQELILLGFDKNIALAHGIRIGIRTGTRQFSNAHSTPIQRNAWLVPKSRSWLASNPLINQQHKLRTVSRCAQQLKQQRHQQQPLYQTRGFASGGSNALQRFTGSFSLNSSNKIVYTILGINWVVFAVWQYAEANAQRFRDGRLYYFMFRNFTDSAQNLREGRIWTLLTAAFSHKEWYHIILNTMVLLSFGDPVWLMLGTRRFLAAYLGSAIASSLSSIGYYSYMEPYLRKLQHKPKSNTAHFSLGASGAIMGITTAFACVHPWSQYSLFFVINMPAVALIGLFGAYELYNVLSTNTGRFDSAGHLGGGLFGAGYYFLRLRPLIRKMGRR